MQNSSFQFQLNHVKDEFCKVLLHWQYVSIRWGHHFIKKIYGNYKLVPLSDDMVVSPDELDAKIRRGIAEYEKDKTIAMKDGESSEDYLERLLSM